MDNCTTHMWLASRAKPLKQLPSVRRPSLVRQVAVQCPTLQEPSPPPRTSLTAFSFTRVRFCQMYFSNSLLKLYFSDMSKFALMKAWRNAKGLTVLCSSGFPWFFLRQLSLESAAAAAAGVTIPASLRPRSIYTPIAAPENGLQQHKTKKLVLSRIFTS